jgi:uncharacterized protein
MKILVKDINSKGMTFEETVPMESIGLTSQDMDLRGGIHVKANLVKVGDVIAADTKVSSDFGYVCARCLENFYRIQTRSYKFDLEINPENEYVDLGEEIRQELILDNPCRLLCKEDCKGICMGCRVNLNLEQCKCK